MSLLILILLILEHVTVAGNECIVGNGSCVGSSMPLNSSPQNILGKVLAFSTTQDFSCMELSSPVPSQKIPEFFPKFPKQQDQTQVSSLITVLPIWVVSSSLVLSCLEQNETGNADL